MQKQLRLPLFILLCFLSLKGFSQGENEGYKNYFWVKWGLNAGVSWQTSDVRCRLGPGWGSTLEIPLVQSRRGNVVLGLRGRYLWTRTFGQDWERSTAAFNDAVNGTNNPGVDYTSLGYYYANHRTSAHEWSGELNLTFQPAYDRPGWFFNIFGGIGANGYKVDIEQEAVGFEYDYSQVSTASRQEALQDLRNLYFIRNWESEGLQSRRPHWVFAPAVGVGLGYKVSPHFSFGWEYKLTFPFTDDFDGQRFADLDNRGRNGNDIYHYTNFGLNVHFGGRSTYTGTTVIENDPPRNYSSYNPPVISVLYPTGGDRNITGNCVSDFRVRIRNISRKRDIRIYINNQLIPEDRFQFDAASGYVTFTGYLKKGGNEIRVYAENRDGKKMELINVTCTERQQVNEVMTVCVPAGPNRRDTRVISVRDWPYYRSLGAVPGPCPVVVREIPICVFDPLSPTGSQTLLIPESEWSYYASIGASRGPCSNRMIEICTTDPDFPSRRITQRISETAWPWYRSNGATRGPCPQICSCLTICMIDPMAPGGARTLTITQNEWPQYQAMGAVLGPCNDRQIQICYTEPCSGEPAQTLMIKESAWPYYQQRGATRGPCPVPQITVCIPDENAAGGSRTVSINENEWPRYQAMGASWGSCSSRFITICYPTPGGNRVTMSISETVWNYYRDRGAVRGVCPPETMTICLPDPQAAGGSRTLTISETEWPYYQSRGATQGDCSGSMQTICWPDPVSGQPSEIRVSSTVVNWYLNQGGTRGPCPVQQISICLPDPQSPGGSRTMMIAANQWPQYQSQGAVQGPCGGQTMIICWKPGTEDQKTITIPEALWSWYQSRGATQGKCTPPSVVVCLPDPNMPNGSREVTIPRDQLQYYLSQGAVEGRCSSEMITICWENPANPGTKNQMSISSTAWPYYQNLGATRGACPEPEIQICLPDPLETSGGRTLTIPRSEWPRYQAMGAVQGSCRGQMTICIAEGNPIRYNSIRIYANLWPYYQSRGAVKGECPEPDVVLCVPDATAPNGSRQIKVKESEVQRYLANGAVRGRCSVENITICVPAGVLGRQKQEMQVSSSVWPYYQGLGATRGACPEPEITICVPDPNSVSGGRSITIPESLWPTYQERGAVRGDCGTEFLLICYKEGGRGNGTMNIPRPLWPHYQSLGATQGKCRNIVVLDSMDICIPARRSEAGGNTIRIARRDFPRYQAQGAVEGSCGESIEICLPSGLRSGGSSTMKIPANLLPHYQSLGATRGACPPPDITICLPDPNDPTGGKTLTIPEDELEAYKAQGAIVGPCEGGTMICWPDPNAPNGSRTIRVPDGLVDWYLANGGSRGTCPDPTTVVCMPDANAPGGSREITIQLTQLSSYLNQGATQGRCDAHQTTLCYNDQTISVSNTVVNWFTQQGATTGNCPEPTITICMPDSNAPGGSNELTIAQSQWASYQAQGAVQGPCETSQTVVCLNNTTISVSNSVLSWYTANGATRGACPEPTITICLPDTNAPNGSRELTIAQSQWPTYQVQGAVQGACPTTTMNICFNGTNMTVSTAVGTWYLENGGTSGPCPEPSVTVCMPDSSAQGGAVQLSIPASQLQSYLQQGAVQGACDGLTSTLCVGGTTMQITQTLVSFYLSNGATNGECAEPTVTICMPDPNQPYGSNEMTIPQSQLASYLAQGAVQGPCATGTTAMCYQGTTMNVTNTVVSWYTANGATNGTCPEVTIDICLPDPSAQGGSRQLTIPQSQWPTYQAQGAIQGTCSSNTEIVCYNNQTMTISSTVLSWFLNNGATQGECAPTMLTICLPDANSTNGSRQLTINQNEWATYQAQGAVQGPCSGTTATVCYQGSNLTISITVRDWYLNNGATNGPCSGSGLWDRSSVSVTGSCDGNVAVFTVTNTGQLGQGDMLGPVQYRWFEDNQQVATGSLQLQGGDSRMLTRPSNGMNIRLEVDQRPGHPGNSRPRADVTCGSSGDGGGNNNPGGNDERKITICHVPPSNPKNPRTIEINESEWSNYRSTSTEGRCDMTLVDMCINGNNERIPASSVNFFIGTGAQRGRCPEPEITICNVPPSNPRNPQTLTIKESEWGRYSRSATRGACDMRQIKICLNGNTETIPEASFNYFRTQGAVRGECRIAMITICNIPPSNPRNPRTMEIKETDWPRYSRESTKGACNMQQMTICYQGKTEQIPTASLPYFQARGATTGRCAIPKINICNVPPSNPGSPRNLTIDEDKWSNYASSSHKGECNMSQKTICYRNQTQNVPVSSWNVFYSKNGATEGACPRPKIDICNVPPSNPSAPQNLKIDGADWGRYAANAHRGTCNMSPMAICYQGRNISVPTSSYDVFYSKQGATKGNCPVKKITICNVPPSNPAAPKNLSIPEDQWSRYAATSLRGECNMRQITICFQGKTLNVPTSSWSQFYSKKGATQGACPRPKITICNVPPSNPSAPKNLQIEESEWSKYARTSHKGGCNTKPMEICYKDKTLSVPTSSWSVFYSKNGAKQGKCVTKINSGSKDNGSKDNGGSKGTSTQPKNIRLPGSGGK